jgi:hypothetical protein
MIKTLFTTLFLFSAAAAQQISTGLPFLKTGSDARSSAMGEAGTAVVGDHSSFSYNPASLRFTSEHELMIGHRQGFADVTTDHLGATIPSGELTYGITALTTSVSDIEVRQRPGEAEGTFSARNAALGVGIAYSVLNDLSVGVTGKLLYEKIYVDEASGYAFDAGAVYKITNDITAGLSVLNIGSMSALRSASTELPTTVRIGGSYAASVTSDIAILGAGDVVKTLNDDGMHLHLGAEAVYNSMFMLRAGYQSGYESRSFTAGTGVRYGIVRLDYAFIPMSGSFSPNHSFSLVFFL